MYQPPAPGEADHADPNFKPRLRDCGKPECNRTFETTARWRYFCPKCRHWKARQKPPWRTFSIPGKARRGDAD